MNFAPYQDLAAAVVARAADDYRTIKKGGKVKGASEREIVRFFKSDYCQILCGTVSAKMIFKRLNDEITACNESIKNNEKENCNV